MKDNLMRPIISVMLMLTGLSEARAIPVYLEPWSLFPSGNYARELLEKRTTEVQLQPWYRVKTQLGSYGWIPDDHVLTPLKLATRASLKDRMPLRPLPRMESLSERSLDPGVVVQILEQRSGWVRILPPQENTGFWIPAENLRADHGPTSRGWTRERVIATANVHTRSASVGSVEARSFVDVLSVTPERVRVRFRKREGFIPRSSVILSTDLAGDEVMVTTMNLPLRTAPGPDSDLVILMPASAKLKVLDRHVQKWGKVQVKDSGFLWWPIDEKFASLRTPGQDDEIRLKTSELFKRGLFDMASSSAIPNLKFASADGVFRSIDGVEWTRLETFKNQNHPIAISPAGTVFIGPYMSHDHGETFHSYIRWDQLVATLKKQFPISGDGIQILEIKPISLKGEHLALKLNAGLTHTVRVQSDNQGLTWTTF